MISAIALLASTLIGGGIGYTLLEAFSEKK